MSLSDFARSNTVGGGLGRGGSGSSLATFAGRSSNLGFGVDDEANKVRFGVDAPLVPHNKDSADHLAENNPSAWKRIVNNLMKPVSTVAVASEQLGGVIGHAVMGRGGAAFDEFKSTPGKIGGIWTGTLQRSFIDVYRDNWEAVKVDSNNEQNVAANFWNDGVPEILGTLTDIAADPTNFVGNGLTKTGILADKITKLQKAGTAISSNSKLAAQAKAMGLTPDLLELGATKAEQVQKGQRALLTIMANTRWEKTIYGGSRVYDVLDVAGAGIKQTKASQIVGKVFSTKTSDEGFNVVRDHFKNLNEYRNGKVMDEAIDLQNTLAKLPTEDARRVIDVIETGKGSGIDEVDALAGRLKGSFDEMRKAEEGLGLLKTDIENYFPHQLAKKSETMTTFQKLKSLFLKADGTVVDDVADGFGDARVWSTKLDSSKARKYEGTIAEIKEAFGVEFDDRAAIAYARRALASSKAVTSREFFDSVKQFAMKADNATPGVAVKVKELEGMTFAPDVARQIDRYYDAVKPKELNEFLKTFDAVQNWWKAQALTAPSYHIRNQAGNMWNNQLAGVVDPRVYYDAGKLQTGKAVQFVDDAGRAWDNSTLMDAAKRSGVINEGWYAKDIDVALGSELGGLSWNPLKQNFGLFRANRAVGTAFENNARLAHFIDKLKAGHTVDDAAMSVKKYLFDYGDLTWAEQAVFKRAMPFYTWTRKNIPLQVGALLTQQGRIAATGASKVVNAIESNVEKPDEKYLGDYIKNNVGIRVGTDKEGNTLYFLLGMWLPSAQALDFLSQPTENLIMGVSPLIKTPIELWANQSSFFEDTFGQPSKIERYPGENQSWLGFTMRKKTAYILKNIRILNELDKLNPGSIFGDKDSPSLANRIAPEAGFKAPFGIGYVTTSEQRGGRFTAETDQVTRGLQSLFGKASVYDPGFAKKFYLWDTETKVRELERAIEDAQRDGQKEYAKRLREELTNVKKSR